MARRSSTRQPAILVSLAVDSPAEVQDDRGSPSATRSDLAAPSARAAMVGLLETAACRPSRTRCCGAFGSCCDGGTAVRHLSLDRVRAPQHPVPRGRRAGNWVGWLRS